MNEYLAKPAIGPGSQTSDSDGELEFMKLPSGMMIYEQPILPEPEEITGLDAGLDVAREVLNGLQQIDSEGPKSFDINALDEQNRDFIDQLLGEGEVGVQWLDDSGFSAQEAVLAGVWRVQQLNDTVCIKDSIEIGKIPGRVIESTFVKSNSSLDIDALDIPSDVYNAPPLLTEINDHLTAADFSVPHVINLSLLPHTQEDINFLADTLGVGDTIILSRGYGNCRISSTQTKNVWWVQYFNSQDTMILNTIEVSVVPEVACAAKEDFEDSAERLAEIMSLYDGEESNG